MMYDASKKGYVENVSMFLHDESWSHESDQNASLTVACENGHLDVVRTLIELGNVNPTLFNSGSLKAAVLNNQLPVLTYLLSLTFKYSKAVIKEMILSDDISDDARNTLFTYLITRDCKNKVY